MLSRPERDGRRAPTCRSAVPGLLLRDEAQRIASSQSVVALPVVPRAIDVRTGRKGQFAASDADFLEAAFAFPGVARNIEKGVLWNNYPCALSIAREKSALAFPGFPAIVQVRIGRNDHRDALCVHTPKAARASPTAIEAGIRGVAVRRQHHGHATLSLTSERAFAFPTGTVRRTRCIRVLGQLHRRARLKRPTVSAVALPAIAIGGGMRVARHRGRLRERARLDTQR